MEKEEIKLPRSIIASLALEIWRLWRLIEISENQPYPLSLQYSIKKMKDIFIKQGVDFIDLTGELYDAGMAIDILDTEGEKSEGEQTLIIKEMISPIILFQNEILMHGQVILEWRENKIKN